MRKLAYSPAMLIVFGGQKGGTGKSTLATNLSAYLARMGDDVLLVDADPQSTATRWSERRDEAQTAPSRAGIGVAGVPVAQRTGGNISATLRDLSERYQHTIVDVGGRDSHEFRSAISVCDLLVVPLRPSQADLETTGHLDEVVSLVRSMRPDNGPRALAVISMAPTHYRISEAADARAYLSEYTDMRMASTIIHDRKAYRDALIEGLSVLEQNNVQAIEEITCLAKEVLS